MKYILPFLLIFLIGCGDSKPRSATYDPTEVQSSQTVSGNDTKDDPPQSSSTDQTNTDTQSDNTEQHHEHWNTRGKIDSYQILEDNVILSLKDKQNITELVKVPWVNGMKIKIGEEFELNDDQSQWTQESNTQQYGTGWTSN